MSNTAVDALISKAITSKGAARKKALALAAEQLQRCTPARRLEVLALLGDLDACVPLVPKALREGERGFTAIGTALAQAMPGNHLPLINACLDAAKNSDVLGNPVVTANLLSVLIGRGDAKRATDLATQHLELERPVTAVLLTNALLAFAQTGTVNAVARRHVKRVLHELEAEDGLIFTAGRGLQAVAHAWLGLWSGAKKDLDGAWRHLAAARALEYADFALLPTMQPAFGRVAAHAPIAKLFEVDPATAIETKTNLIKKNKRDWWSVFSRGLLFHEGGDLKRAVKDYQKTIELNPDYPDVYVNLGNISWTRDRDFAEAVRWYGKALMRADGHYLARLNRAEARLHLGDFAGAEHDAIKALHVRSTSHGEALRALALLRLGNEKEAAKAARKAIALDPKLASLDDGAWREELRRL